MADRKFGFETLCLHAGQIPDAATGARAAPIYQTTSFVFDSAEHAASLFNLQTFGNVYSRISNPTVAVFEERMAALEGGRSALAAATGQAAEVTAILTLCSSGDHIVSASTLYGGTHTLLNVNLKKLGIETTFVDPVEPENFHRAIKTNTKLLYAETLGNPLINIVDIEALAKIAHGDHAHLRPGALADERLAPPPGPRIAPCADGPALRERARRGQVPARASARRLGELPGPARQQIPSPGAEISGEGRIRPAQLR